MAVCLPLGRRHLSPPRTSAVRCPESGQLAWATDRIAAAAPVFRRATVSPVCGCGGRGDGRGRGDGGGRRDGGGGRGGDGGGGRDDDGGGDRGGGGREDDDGGGRGDGGGGGGRLLDSAAASRREAEWTTPSRTATTRRSPSTRGLADRQYSDFDPADDDCDCLRTRQICTAVSVTTAYLEIIIVTQFSGELQTKNVGYVCSVVHVHSLIDLTASAIRLHARLTYRYGVF